MSKYSALIKRASNATTALALTVASLTPAVMLGGSARAAQIQLRSINMSTSAPNVASTWTVTVDDLYSGQDFSIKVCTSPLADVDCLNPYSGATVTTATYTGTFGTTVTSGTVSATVNATNPQGVAADNLTSGVGTFYARISIDAGEANENDFGAVAMSTTNDMTINARVQERLTFCVGADTSGNIGETATGYIRTCTLTGGQIVDLGVVDTVRTSPVNTGGSTLGNGKTGMFMLSTNAARGAKVYYDPSSELKVPSATCGTNSDTNDQCFNNATLAESLTSLSSSTEKFGMKVSNIYWTGNSEGVSAPRLSAQNGYGTDFTWEPAGNEIAAATAAVDWDKAVLTFSAAVAASTPSGSYSTSANFVATGLF